MQAAGRQAEAGSPGFVTGPGPATLAARISSSPMNLTQDADGDGVRNADDRCADTPGNTTVATDGLRVYWMPCSAKSRSSPGPTF